MSQINTILVNIFFGPIVNTSRAIALQINSALSSFCGSFLTAINPPMVKSYAENDYYYLNKVFYLSNKFIYYSLFMLSIPICYEMDIILKLWLGVVDSDSILFSRLILLYSIIIALNNPISIIIQATGHVKEYFLSVEIFTILCVPVTYILFKMGFPAYATFITMIGSAILAHIVRLVCLKRFYPQFSYKTYLLSFMLSAIVISFITSFALYFVHTCIISTVFRLFIMLLSSVIISVILVYLIGLSNNERLFLKSIIANLYKTKIKNE